MKCELLFMGKNVSKCRLLKFLPRVLSVKNNQIGKRGFSTSFQIKGKAVDERFIAVKGVVSISALKLIT